MRFDHKREYYIPKGAVLHKEEHGLSVWFYESAGKVGAIGFRGKAQKHCFHYTFRNEEHREAFVEKQFEGAKMTLAAKAQYREARKPVQASEYYKIGDILYYSWGYDQTNIDWFEVTGVHGTQVELRAIGANQKETGFMSGETMPVKGAFLENSPPFRKSVKKDGYITFDHGCGTKWDGRKKHNSWYA